MDRRLRLAVLGPSRVGKTSILKRYLDNTFCDRYRETVEDIHSKDFYVHSTLLPLDIYDTNFAFPAMRKLTITSANAILLVFAVDDEASFEQVCDIMAEILDIRRKGFDDIPIVVAGNKSDVSERTVSQSKIDALNSTLPLSARYNVRHLEVSAKTGSNIGGIFKTFLKISGFPSNLQTNPDGSAILCNSLSVGPAAISTMSLSPRREIPRGGNNLRNNSSADSRVRKQTSLRETLECEPHPDVKNSTNPGIGHSPRLIKRKDGSFNRLKPKSPIIGRMRLRSQECRTTNSSSSKEPRSPGKHRKASNPEYSKRRNHSSSEMKRLTSTDDTQMREPSENPEITVNCKLSGNSFDNAQLPDCNANIDDEELDDPLEDTIAENPDEQRESKGVSRHVSFVKSFHKRLSRITRHESLLRNSAKPIVRVRNSAPTETMTVLGDGECRVS